MNRQAIAHSTETKNHARANMRALYHILVLMVLALPLAAQKTPWPDTFIQFFNNDGSVCAGCLVYPYLAGTTTFTATYTVATGGASNTQPIVLDSAGRAQIYLTAGVSYRFDLCSADGGASTCTPDGVLISTQDNVPGGTLAGASNASANTVFAGPTTGAAATPTFRALVAADLPAITATTCANQVITAITTGILGTCTTITGAYFGTAIAARSGFGNNSTSAAAPAFSTTMDRLAYQVAEIPSSVFVASDFTTSGVGTALEAITGLTWTIPALTALNVPFICSLTYSQAVGNDAVAFGVQDVTVSPTNIAARGILYTNTTASTEGNLPTLTTTTATSIVSATPAATGTNFVAQISGLIEAPSNASSSAIRILVSTATAADLVTVKRGSFCRMN